MFKTLFAVACLLYTGISHAASFDCQKAETRIEKAICNHTELSDLDEYLGRYYGAAQAFFAEGGDCLKADQKQWLKKRNTCQTNACIKTAYLERLSVLDAVQPGVSALKNIELPKQSPLVWIIPAAADHVAAPPRPQARPLHVKGKLIEDPTFNNGYFLHTSANQDYPLVLMMLAEPSTLKELGNLSLESKETGQVFAAHGYLATDENGKAYFEPSRCTFIYRLP